MPRHRVSSARGQPGAPHQARTVGLGDLVTVAGAARLLGLSRRTVERMVSRGQLPFYHLPVRGGLRFARREILDWLEQRRRPLLD